MSLVPAGLQQLGKHSSEKSFSEIVKSGDWLPYVQLMGSSNNVVKSGKFPMGHFALTEGKVNNDLGEEFDCIVVGWRSKAMDFNKMKSVFDSESDLFRDIQERSKGKDSGCGCGPEFLLWIPDFGKFATYFMCNKSSKAEAPNVLSYLHTSCTLRVEFIDETKKNPHSYHAPKCKACSRDLDPPDWEASSELISKFLNPPDDGTEAASGTGSPER